jgi:hypothetical protein
VQTFDYQLPADSSLQMVETKAASKGQEPLIIQLESPRVKRQRPAKVVLTEEPLQMVETKGDKPASPPPPPTEV